MKRVFKRKVASGFALAAFVTLALAGGLWWVAFKSREAGQRVEHTYMVLLRLRRVAALLDEATAGVRGFYLTGDERFLEAYRRSRAPIERELRALGELTADNPGQQRRLSELEALVAERMAMNTEAIDVMRRQGRDALIATARSGRGERLMGRIRGTVAAMETEERRLLELRSEEATRTRRWMFARSLVGMTVNFTILALLFRVIARETARRGRIEETLSRSEQRYRSLIDAMTAIVWNTPASGEFETEQPAWSAFTGQSFAELKGWGWLDAVHPDDRRHTARVWSAAVASLSLYETV